MDPYLRDFKVNSINTFNLNECHECKEVLDVNKNHNFTILHNNIRSLSKNFDEFKILLDNINFHFDCLVLTETWHLANPELYNILGYNLIYNQGQFNQNDGTVIYLKNNISFKHSIISKRGINFLRADIGHENICITACYRSPASNINDFLQSIQEYFEEDQAQTYEYNIYIGDMNINILENSVNKIEYMNILNEFGYTSMINNPTRKRTCLDHIFFKTKNYQRVDMTIPLILKSAITDHETVILQIILEELKNQHKNNYKEYTNYKKLTKIMQETSWDLVYSQEDPNAATNAFINEIKLAMENCTEKR